MADYGRTFREIDPWLVQIIAAKRQNVVTNMDRVLPGSFFQKSEVYNECIRVHGDDTLHCLAAGMETPWGLGMVGVHRGRGAPDFDEADVAAFQRTIDTLRKVLHVRGEILASRRERALAEDSLDAIGQASVVVSREFGVLQANSVAEAAIRCGSGFSVAGGALTCLLHVDTLSLKRLIAEATRREAPRGGAFVVRRGVGLEPYLATVSPLIGRTKTPAALIVFRIPEAIDESLPHRLRDLFGLTVSESLVAADLGHAATTDQIMAKREVSRNTLKTQLRSIAQKMGCARQSEIAAIVAALPPIATAIG